MMSHSEPHTPDSGWTRAHQRLLELRRLDDDWDGMEASAPTPELVDTVWDYLKQVRADRSAAPVRIVAGPNGEIDVEWQLEGLTVVAEFEEPDLVIWTLRNWRY